jgi:hypothetical protein
MSKANKTYTELIVKKAKETDPSMDFLSTSKKIAKKNQMLILLEMQQLIQLRFLKVVKNIKQCFI